NVTILAAISNNGVENASAKMIKGATTASIFIDFLKPIIQRLDETNAAPHFFVMDYSGIRRARPTQGIVYIICRHTHPFLNPVEETFSKLKGLMKRKPGLASDPFLHDIAECSKQISQR
ncbi:uncharacterized protein BYT42DRAFT_471807, partial [Radiomyces spectabilis]|uniref:uncharacterized protein n=1 Tax=Radiomyces spectabilis TaxID=64574 RepID=UPI00221F485B